MSKKKSKNQYTLIYDTKKEKEVKVKDPYGVRAKQLYKQQFKKVLIH